VMKGRHIATGRNFKRLEKAVEKRENCGHRSKKGNIDITPERDSPFKGQKKGHSNRAAGRGALRLDKER